MKEKQPAVLDYSLTAIGFHEVYGWDGGGVTEVRKQLPAWNLFAVLQFCAKLSLLLFAKTESDLDTQVNIIRRVFPKAFRAKLLGTLKRLDNPKSFVLFHEQATVLLVKEALAHCPQDGGKALNKDDAQELGNLLLILTDYCLEPLGTAPIKLPDTYRREGLRERFAKYSFFRSYEYFPFWLARFSCIFEEARKVGRERGFDVDDFFVEATGGLTLTNYFALSVAVLTNWFQNVGKDIPNIDEWLICRDKYFRKTALTPEQIDLYLGFLSVRFDKFVDEYNSIVEEILGGEDIPNYNFLLLQQKPLIEIRDDCYVCPSPRFLTERSTEGVYWIIENYLKTEKRAERKLWPEIWGKAYENYTNNLLSTALGTMYVPNFRDSSNKERFDGLLLGKAATIPVETKYTHWSYLTKITGKKELMTKDIKKALIKGGSAPKGLGQLSKNINSFVTGDWDFGGVQPKSFLFLPLLIVGERIPMYALDRHLYEEIVADERISLPSDYILPFVILDSEDIQVLESYIYKYGRDAAESILVEYSQTFSDRSGQYVLGATGFKNYVLKCKGGLNYKENTRLRGVFDKIFGESREMIFGSDVYRSGSIAGSNS